MKEEYKKSLHYKTKMENFKIHKVMGRVKKVTKGPNPLSCKKKKKVAYIDRTESSSNNINKNINANASDAKNEGS